MAYSWAVPSVTKTLQRMRNNPRDWRIEDLKMIAKRFGIEHRQQGTSHVVFRASTGRRVSVPAHRPVKPPYIRDFPGLVDSLEISE